MDQDPTPSLDDALAAEPMLEPPADLVDRILAGLPAERPQPRPVLHALARLAAAVVVAIGAWIFAFGAAPGMAEAGPAASIRGPVVPAIHIVDAPTLEIPSLPVEASDASAIAGLAVVGLAILGAGLVVARKLNKESLS
jgi:hypothetical protein